MFRYVMILCGFNTQGGFMIISCQNLPFIPSLSGERIDRAINIFGISVIKRILCFALYLLGMKRPAIARLVEMPTNSTKTIIKNIHNNGIPAFEDRRFNTSAFLPQAHQRETLKVTISRKEDWVNIGFGNDNMQKLKIPKNNKLQLRALLLTMFNSGLLSIQQTSEYLELSTVQTRALAKSTEEKDIGCLLDQRKGQKKEYRFDSETRAETIQQYIANLVNNKSTSSEALSNDLKKRCSLKLSPRTIRLHIAKMGLSKIRTTLPELVGSIKKSSQR
jgi:hypothetical protein